MSAIKNLIEKGWSDEKINNGDLRAAEKDLARLESALAVAKAALTAWKEAYLKLEFDETTGECLMACGGCAAEGHNKDCQFISCMPDGSLLLPVPTLAAVSKEAG